MIATILAQVDLPANWPQTVKTEAGVIGLLCIGVLVLTFVKLCKSVFGRKPPMDEQLHQVVKLLRGEIHREKNSSLKEFKLKLSPVIHRLATAETDIEEIQTDRVRKWESLTVKIGEVANDVSYLRGIKKGEAR